MKKRKNEEFCEMNKKEKKEFLSNDLIERMIRIEQNISTSFGNPILYNKTQYYLSLTPEEKKKFDKFIKTKKEKLGNLIVVFLSLLLIVIIIFPRIEFTGNIITNNFDLESKTINYFFLITAGIIIFMLIIYWLYKKLKSRKYHKHFQVIERILLKKYYKT